jgi:hypothetical protein
MRPATNPIARAVQELDRQIDRLQAARVTLTELLTDLSPHRGRPRKLRNQITPLKLKAAKKKKV